MTAYFASVLASVIAPLAAFGALHYAWRHRHDKPTPEQQAAIDRWSL